MANVNAVYGIATAGVPSGIDGRNRHERLHQGPEDADRRTRAVQV